VNLDLVDGRLYFGEGFELFETLDGPVGHADGTGFFVVVDFFQGAPGWFGVFGQVV
jgi:hypothetical protein